MKAQRLEALPAPAATRSAARPPAGILAQRHSTLGGGSMSAPPILDAGRPLEPATRSEMERGFGRDFGAVRVHDDARAHDNARSLGAVAYAAGNDIVFGQGHYAPQTAAGRALIAHELAHSVQQGGVQMKADGSLPVAADQRLEAEADRAAAAVTAGRAAPTLSRIGAPAVFRQTDANAVSTDAGAKPAQGGAEEEVPGVGKVVVESELPTGAGVGATYASVVMPPLSVPAKGTGSWIQANYSQAAQGGSLAYKANVTGTKFEVITDPEPSYGDIWVQKYGFKTMQELGAAVKAAAAKKPLASANAMTIVNGLAAGSLTNAKCDVDHIVEKQLGGNNIPNNLQLLSKSVNRSSGSRIRPVLADLANKVRTAIRPQLEQIQLRFPIVTVEAEPTKKDDYYLASCEVETLLRSSEIVGDPGVKAGADGTPVGLTALGKSVIAPIRGKGETAIGEPASLLITGMRLEKYVRGTKGGADKVAASLSPKGLLPGPKPVALEAKPGAAPGPVAPPPGSTAAPLEAPAEKGPAPTEWRQLNLPKNAAKDVQAHYPSLSNVAMKTLEIKEDGLHGTAILTPSVAKFLGPIEIRFSPTTLEAVKDIDAAALKTPAQAFFRFTKGSLALTLAPSFVPTGQLDFEIGPQGKPLMLGFVKARYEAGAFIASGELTPAGKIPAVDKAAGTVEYHSQKGWSGKLTAESSSIPGSTVTAELGFRPGKAGLEAYGKGGFSTTVKGSPLDLTLDWDGTTVSYGGKVTVKDPMPLVKEVTLEGNYRGDQLKLTGTAPIVWKSIKANMSVTYRRKDGEEGKFSGAATVEFPKEGKVGGSLDLNFDEAGNFWGKGQVSYQLTPQLRPTLTAEYTKARQLKMSGEVAIGDIALTKEWPAPGGAKKPIIKGVGVKFSVPTPVPFVTAYGEIKGSLGVGYGVGPVMLKGVVLSGELYPLEDDPKPVVTLKGKFSLPAYGELYGTFGAYIGAEILFGVAGAKGGIEVSPSLRISGEAGLAFEAGYASGGFSFAAEAAITAALTAKLKVDFAAEIYALGGLASYRWTYPLAAVSRQIGPQFKMTLGKIAYAPDGTITWPSLSQIKFEPESIDPMKLVSDLMKEGKETKQ
ncbi:MAG TPA: DUF4157 domain-containing protein [Allosphingosinicella sp.]|jgi:hypothetical protein